MKTIKATGVGATIVRNNFQDIIDKVHYTEEPLVISKYGKPWVVIKSLDESDRELQRKITESDTL